MAVSPAATIAPLFPSRMIGHPIAPVRASRRRTNLPLAKVRPQRPVLSKKTPARRSGSVVPTHPGISPRFFTRVVAAHLARQTSICLHSHGNPAPRKKLPSSTPAFARPARCSMQVLASPAQAAPRAARASAPAPIPNKRSTRTHAAYSPGSSESTTRFAPTALHIALEPHRVYPPHQPIAQKEENTRKSVCAPRAKKRSASHCDTILYRNIREKHCFQSAAPRCPVVLPPE